MGVSFGGLLAGIINDLLKQDHERVEFHMSPIGKNHVHKSVRLSPYSG